MDYYHHNSPGRRHSLLDVTQTQKWRPRSNSMSVMDVSNFTPNISGLTNRRCSATPCTTPCFVSPRMAFSTQFSYDSPIQILTSDSTLSPRAVSKLQNRYSLRNLPKRYKTVLIILLSTLAAGLFLARTFGERAGQKTVSSRQYCGDNDPDCLKDDAKAHDHPSLKRFMRSVKRPTHYHSLTSDLDNPEVETGYAGHLTEALPTHEEEENFGVSVLLEDVDTDMQQLQSDGYLEDDDAAKEPLHKIMSEELAEVKSPEARFTQKRRRFMVVQGAYVENEQQQDVQEYPSEVEQVGLHSEDGSNVQEYDVQEYDVRFDGSPVQDDGSLVQQYGGQGEYMNVHQTDQTNVREGEEQNGRQPQDAIADRQTSGQRNEEPGVQMMRNEGQIIQESLRARPRADQHHQQQQHHRQQEEHRNAKSRTGPEPHRRQERPPQHPREQSVRKINRGPLNRPQQMGGSRGPLETDRRPRQERLPPGVHPRRYKHAEL